MHCFLQNQSMTAYTPTFLIGSNKNANVVTKDVSAVLCSIRLNECEGSSIAVLESKGSKGYVYANGRVIKTGTNYVLRSRDEVLFGSLGNHAYVSFF
ncbi:putative forkhead-associated (FHA) domain, SMAD/FHA domain superfamily [Helianthus anomalus]